MHPDAEVTFRVATAADAPALVEVYAERLTPAQRAWAPARPAGALELFAEQSTHAFPFGVVVAEQRGTLLGYCSLVPFRSAPALRSTMGESSICVRESARARGVAQGLIARVTDAARYGGLEYQLAFIDRENAAAIATARSTGAERVGGLPASARNPQRPVVDLYAWNLATPAAPDEDAILARLALQATCLSPFELDAFDAALGAGTRIVELGCGPGAWLGEMQRHRPGHRWFGVDRSPTALARMPEGVERARVDIVAEPAALRAVLASVRPDLVVLRFVLQHLSAAARGGLLRELADASVERLLVIDADDRLVECPHLRLLLEPTGAFARARGGDREVLGALPAELQAAGWSASPATTISTGALRDPDALALMWPVAEAGLRCAPTHEGIDALHRLDGATARRYRYGAVIAERAGA